MARHRERCLELRLDATLPNRVIVPDGAPGDAGGKARLGRGAARRVVAAEADGDDADPFGVHVRAPLQEIDAGAAGLLVVVAQHQPAEADRLAGARPVHRQHRNAALDQLRHAGEVLDLLGDVEAVEEHDARRARRLRVLRMHEIARQAPAFERHLDDLDLDVGELDKTVEAIDRNAIGVERLLVLGRAEAFAHLIIMTGAQMEGRRRHRVARRAEALAVRAHLVGDRHAGVEPGLVVVARLALEQASDLVQLADVGAAIAAAAEHVDEGRRPPVVAREIHEIFRRLRHGLLLALSAGRGTREAHAPRQSQADTRPMGLAILPSGRLSAAMRAISSALSVKSNTARFSAMRLALDERGIGTMLPCWTSQRSAIWASGRPLWAAMSASTGSRSRRPRPSGQ